jgi:ATP-binding cassette, subfamily C, bacteriocin exporter
MAFFNKIFKRQPIRIRQHDLSDCGAACIASISQYYKVKIPIARIRQIAHTTQRGTNVLGLTEAFAQIGFSAKGVKGKWESVEKIPKPAIAHIVLENQLQHYVVIYEVKPTKICVMDPADGRLHWYSKEDFSKKWTGILVICQPNVDLKPRNEKISITNRILHILSPHTSVLSQSIVGAFLFTLSNKNKLFTTYILSKYS